MKTFDALNDIQNHKKILEIQDQKMQFWEEHIYIHLSHIYFNTVIYEIMSLLM